LAQPNKIESATWQSRGASFSFNRLNSSLAIINLAAGYIVSAYFSSNYSETKR